MGLMEISVNLDSLRTHGDTLYMSGTKIAKVLFVGVDSSASDTKIGLIDGDPYTMKLHTVCLLFTLMKIRCL